MSSFDQRPVFFHSFIIEGLPSQELLSFARSIKMDQTVRGASKCEVSLFHTNGVEKLEARNIFDDESAREEYMKTLTPPNHDALAEIGIRLSTVTGTIVFDSAQPSRSATSSSLGQDEIPPQSEQVQRDKSAWPELVNTSSSDAVRIISIQRPDIHVMLVPQGAMVTMDYRLDRVRVFHNEESGMVTSIPKIG